MNADLSLARRHLASSRRYMGRFVGTLPGDAQNPQAGQAVLLIGLIDQLQSSVQSLATQEVSDMSSRGDSTTHSKLRAECAAAAPSLPQGGAGRSFGVWG